MKEGNNILKYDILKNYSLISFTTTCHGGVSKGRYESFNLSLYSGDNSEHVNTNRHILAESLNIKEENLLIPFQTHEDKICLIDKDFLSLSKKDKMSTLNGVDALITQEKEICIGVTTADCVPVLIYDPIQHALGVVHAGWKGTVKKIASKTIQHMSQTFHSKPSDLIVVIGPSISQKAFEVGDEVGEAFSKNGFDLNKIAYRHKTTCKLHIDLWQANKDLMTAMGVKESNVAISGICTFTDRNFFSARRQTINSGRIVTGGVLK